MSFVFEVGQTYYTQAGEQVTVVGRTELLGYECLECNDGRYRYDRSTSPHDAGRVTGSAHDYTYPHNFERPPRHPGVAPEKTRDTPIPHLTENQARPTCPACGYALDDHDMSSDFGATDLWALPLAEEVASIECPQCDAAYWVKGGYTPRYSSAFAEEQL